MICKHIKNFLNWDRKQRAEDSGEGVEYLLAFNKPLSKESWRRMQGWYKDDTNLPPPPTHVSISRVMA